MEETAEERLGPVATAQDARSRQQPKRPRTFLEPPEGAPCDAWAVL